MKLNGIQFSLLAVFSSCLVPVKAQQPHNFEVNVNKVVAPVQSTMYGIFFEDINFAADGGLYAEMVKNRSFEFTLPMMGWNQPNSDRHSLNEKSGFTSVINTGADVNAHFAEVTVNDPAGYVLINEGFRGIGVKEGAQYNLSLEARSGAGNISKIHFQLVDSTGAVVGETSIVPEGFDWKEYKTSFDATSTLAKAKLKITFEGTGKVDLDMISLFPDDTWKHRPDGLRKDLVQLLYDLHPGFLRFPGGCIVEGRNLARRYQWKNTIGPVEDRKLIVNRWNTEFQHRLTPDYYQSFGLGFFEYFQLAEDIGAEPLPILNCGMACQFNTGELVPMDKLDPYVQDALDLIEFANGPVTSKWGEIRSQMGHPQPFHMKFIGVGNEQWGPQYIDRYKAFVKAIKAQYPDITIVAAAGPFPDGEDFDYAWKNLKDLKAQIIDEHYYRSPEWFLQNADRYDTYDRNGPKVFAGEYAAQSVAIASPDNKNNWRCALAEAAFMTGLERNADEVYMTSYAPLLANANAWQWTPDLIWFNNLQSYGTPDYYVQKLFSNNKGTDLLNITENGIEITGQDSLYASAVKDTKTGMLICKIVNASAKEKKVKINLKGVKKEILNGTVTSLSSADMDAVNSFGQPKNISPEESVLEASGTRLPVTVKGYSLIVVRIKLK